MKKNIKKLLIALIGVFLIGGLFYSGFNVLIEKNDLLGARTLLAFGKQ